MDESNFCDTAEHRLYIQIIGMILWIMRLDHVDIAFAISSFSRFFAIPRLAHLGELEKIIGFLEKYPDKRLAVDSQPQTFPGRLLTKSRKTIQALYPDAKEEIDTQFQRPKVGPIYTRSLHSPRGNMSKVGIMYALKVWLTSLRLRLTHNRNYSYYYKQI